MQIQVKDLLKIYNEKEALNIPDFSIQKSELLGIIGNNGAGKTTLFRLMLDLLKPDKGLIINGQYNVMKSGNWKNSTNAYLDKNFLIDFLMPEEYFSFIAKCYGISQSQLQIELSSFEQFMNSEILRQHKLIRDFSAGNQQKIGIIGSLITNPEIIIMDEPYNYLDPSSQIILKNILQKINKERGCTIILSSHNLTHISEICTRIALMEKGKIIKEFSNSPSDIDKIGDYFRNQVRNTD